MKIMHFFSEYKCLKDNFQGPLQLNVSTKVLQTKPPLQKPSTGRFYDVLTNFCVSHNSAKPRLCILLIKTGKWHLTHQAKISNSAG